MSLSNRSINIAPYKPLSMDLVLLLNSIRRFQVKPNNIKAGLYYRLYANRYNEFGRVEIYKIKGRPYSDSHSTMIGSLKLRHATLGYDGFKDYERGTYVSDFTGKKGAIAFHFNARGGAAMNVFQKTSAFDMICLLRGEDHTLEAYDEFVMMTRLHEDSDNEFYKSQGL